MFEFGSSGYTNDPTMNHLKSRAVKPERTNVHMFKQTCVYWFLTISTLDRRESLPTKHEIATNWVSLEIESATRRVGGMGQYLLQRSVIISLINDFHFDSYILLFMSVLSNQNGNNLSIIWKSRRNFCCLRQKRNPISEVIDAEFLWRTFFALSLLLLCFGNVTIGSIRHELSCEKWSFLRFVCEIGKRDFDLGWVRQTQLVLSVCRVSLVQVF